MGNVQARDGYRAQNDRLPYQGSPSGLDHIAPKQQAPPQAAYDYAPQPALQPNLEERPMYEWLLRRAGQVTRGVARVDLIRPRSALTSECSRLPSLGENGAPWRAGEGDGRVGYPSVRGGDAYSRMRQRDFGGGGEAFAGPEHGRLRFGAARGARIKLMRCIDIGGRPRAVQELQAQPKLFTQAFGNDAISEGISSPGVLGKVAGAFQAEPAFQVAGARAQDLGPRQPLASLGIGGSFELDSLSIEPALRLRFQDWLTIKFMPTPVLKLQKSLRLPNSPLNLRLRYEVPLDAIEDGNLLRPPARLLARLDNHVGSGVHLSPTGVDFDQRVVTLARDTSVRFAGRAQFPKQVPVPEGRPLLDWEVSRLGLKTSW